MISHLKDVKESYFVHLGFTLRIAVGFLFLAAVSLIHGLFPFMLISVVSNQVDKLNKILNARS